MHREGEGVGGAGALEEAPSSYFANRMRKGMIDLRINAQREDQNLRTT